MKFSMTGQEKGDLLIQVTAWAGLTIYIQSGCGRVVQGAGRKAKRMVLQCINGVGSNPVEGRAKI